jgi:hypothetical protein
MPDPISGQLVACNIHGENRLFRIVDGRRVWLTPPPRDQTPDPLPIPCASLQSSSRP